jgi:ribonuclease T2
MMVRFATAFIVTVSVMFAATQSQAAENSPHQFDFYVLSLSWSPSYCAGIGNQRQDPQCNKPFGFVVHGLWPEQGSGTAVVCEKSDVPLPRALVNEQLDIFPAPGLVIHEWRTHGACSGMDPTGYFSFVHKAFASITVPAAYGHIDQPQMMDTSAIAKDFMTANKGLDASEMAVACNRQGLEEIRICISKDLKSFHACADIVGNSCKSPKVYVPAKHAAN